MPITARSRVQELLRALPASRSVFLRHGIDPAMADGHGTLEALCLAWQAPYWDVKRDLVELIVPDPLPDDEP